VPLDVGDTFTLVDGRRYRLIDVVDVADRAGAVDRLLKVEPERSNPARLSHLESRVAISGGTFRATWPASARIPNAPSNGQPPLG
jgi:hypothetical protein